MSSQPFHSFTFTLVEDKRPRSLLRMKALEDGFYELHVEKGSAAHPSSQFTRKVPGDTAERLRDSLQQIGVFGWEESYGDAAAPGTRRWAVNTVFQEDVFSVVSKGGSDVPPGFDALLEELYRLDFPRPSAGQRAEVSAKGPTSASLGLNPQNLRGMSRGDLGAYSATGGIDFSQMADSLKGGLGGIDAHEMQQLLSQAQTNPQAFQQRMRQEFRHLPAAEQNQMLDALAATGMATREWWKRFFGL